MIDEPMFDKLAIILLGAQNTGKTSTLREYSNYYYHKKVSTFKKGWRIAISPFKPKFYTVKVFIYFLPGSPTETRIPLADTVEPLDWYPDVLLMAEQLNGSEYQNTINYLRAHRYHIKEFKLSDNNGIGIWDRWTTKLEETTKLLYRREAVADYVRNFIINRI
jgi:GTPase SAR1 family protein